MGPSGSGKSTLLNVLSSLISPQKGISRSGNYSHRYERRTIRYLPT
ncbi:ATP-binding cassette domain-containing protein [Priestia sp. OVL9]|nr:ATP-binding cassette domain-containing protein [Priestia sp. OVL9]